MTDEPQGTFACPICGKDTPHGHTALEQSLHRKAVRVGDAEGEWVLVPKSALDWLNGEGDSFEPPEGSRGAFWWRTEFKRRCEMIAAINPESGNE